VEIQRPSDEFLAAGSMENCFTAAADHVERYMRDGATVGEGAAVFATWHLMTRSLVDLRAGQFLASEGRPIQMASVVRPVLESLNLIELFAQEPEAAQSWADGDYKEFVPWKVRKRLGIEDDQQYSYLSEVSHPRFAGLQLTAFRVEREGADRPIAHLYLGGLPMEIPWVLLATMAPANVLGQLSLTLSHLLVKEEVARTWPTVARRVMEEIVPGYEAVIASLDRHGVGQDTSAKMLAELQTALGHARELEEAYQEAWDEEEARRRGDAGADPSDT
jgi:hypothetical protein